MCWKWRYCTLQQRRLGEREYVGRERVSRLGRERGGAADAGAALRYCTLQQRRLGEREYVGRERVSRLGRERGGAADAGAAHESQRCLRAVQVRLAHQGGDLHQHLYHTTSIHLLLSTQFTNCVHGLLHLFITNVPSLGLYPA